MNRSVCSICADYLTCENCVACPCGHTFHSQCINRWKETSSTCPQCRKSFKKTTKLFYELSREDQVEADPAVLQNEVTELKLRIRIRDSSIETLQKQNKDLTQEMKDKVSAIKSSQDLLENALGTNDALKKQLTYMEKFKNNAKKAKEELVTLQKSIGSFRNIQVLVDSESCEIEKTLKNFADNPDAFNQICTSYVVLKKEFERLKDSKRLLENEKKTLRRNHQTLLQESTATKNQLDVVTNDLKSLDDRNKKLSKKVLSLEKIVSSSTPCSSSTKRHLYEPPQPGVSKKLCKSTFDIHKELNEMVADESEGTNEDSGVGIIDLSEDLSGYEENLTSGRKILNDTTNKKQPGNSVSTSRGHHDIDTIDEHSAFDISDDLDLDEESIKIAEEFGIPYVATTSSTIKRDAMHISKNNSKSGFVFKKQNSIRSNFKSTNNEISDLPHIRKGFNGMGGQSKTLVIPKKYGPLTKQPANKKSFKIPKNNVKITKFVSNPSLPSIELSP